MSMELDIGSEVYWNDPDNGQCSGWRIIQEFHNEEIVVLTDEQGVETTEAFIHELT